MDLAIIRNGRVENVAMMVTGFDTIELKDGEIFSVRINGPSAIPSHLADRVNTLRAGSDYLRLKMGNAVAEIRIGKTNGKLYIGTIYVQGPTVSDVVALKDYIYREFLGERTVELYPDGSAAKMFQVISETVQTTVIQGIQFVNGVLAGLSVLQCQAK